MVSASNLEWRVRLFGVGAILAVAGIAAEVDWLVTAAIVVLVAGFLVRFLDPSRRRPDDAHVDDEDQEDAST